MKIADRVSRFNRERKWRLFNRVFKIKKNTLVLDVGFTDVEYSDIDNYLERNYSYPENITALGLDEPKKFLKRYPKVKVVQYNGKKFPFSDNYFNICWSNAVLEHVGSRKNQIEFLKEVNRVANSFFITTPNRYFPIEVHTKILFLHWLPKRYFDYILPWFNKSWARGNYMNLLSLGELKELLKEAGINDYKIVKNRFFGFVLDFVVYGVKKI